MAERGAPADPSGDLSACVAPTGIQGRGRGSVSLRDGEPNLPLSGPRAHTIMGSSMVSIHGWAVVSRGCGCGEPWVAGEGVVDGVDGADVVAAGADQVGTDTAVCREGAQRSACASSRRRPDVVSGP